MKFGLSPSEFDFLQAHLIQPLKDCGARVFIFGSRATGKYQQFSDIDILFVDSASVIQDSFLNELKNKIEESSFPYKLDLVNNSQLASSYRAQVESQKIEL